MLIVVAITAVLAVLSMYLVAVFVASSLRYARYRPQSGDLRVRLASGKLLTTPEPRPSALKGPRGFAVFEPTTTRAEIRRHISDDDKPAMIQVFDDGRWSDLSLIRF